MDLRLARFLVPMLALPFVLPGTLPAQISARSTIKSEVAAGPPTGVIAPVVAARTFHDPAYKISFDYPGDWIFASKDREISTFRLDARSAARTTTMRAVASIAENPFPDSTFSGAYFYLSVTPHSNDASCARQAQGAATATPGLVPHGGDKLLRQVAGLSFAHGYDEQKNICTTARDEIYTVYRRGACYRFDLAMNNFCGGEVSGVKDVTPEELDDVRRRMEAILGTVRFDGK
jgi:hypothetical protein